MKVFNSKLAAIGLAAFYSHHVATTQVILQEVHLQLR